MSEKLTKETVDLMLHEEIEPFPRTERALDRIWDAIQSDREAIRKEVTEELLKDHFKIGEEAESFCNGEWVKGVIACTSNVLVANVNVRRPPKTRPMTREEKINALIDREGAVWTVSACSTDDGIDSALKLLKITPEVPL